MQLRDTTYLALGAVRTHRLRSFLSALGIAVGIAAVVLLTSIGEGVHRFVLSEFTQFGSRLIAVTPGLTTTHGVSGAILGTVRPLALEDAEALRKVPHIEDTVPVVQGNAIVEAAGRSRRTTVLGVGPAMLRVWSMNLAAGKFLPADDPRRARPFTVLGLRVRRELFAGENPIGKRVRVGGHRYRVLGITAAKGQVLGFDMDDMVFLPAARAQEIFNREGLMEIDVLYAEGASVEAAVAGIRRRLVARHGQEDFTITTQKQMLDVLGSVLGVLTFAVGALGGISLLVGGVGILTITKIAVAERTAEIGLLRALGATRRQIHALFLSEAVLLAGLGGLAGFLAGTGGALALAVLVPALPVHTPWWFVLVAEAAAVLVGLLAGVLPASGAARLDPVDALRAE